MNEQLAMRECTSTVNVARDWLKGMGDAAISQNFSIQYCMTLPSITMNSASIHASTHQRLGGDYLDGDNANNWDIGSASIFIWGVGLLPFKDTFLSNGTQTPPTHANSGTGKGGFKGFHEQAPQLHAISAILSTGPVSPSDGIGGADKGLLMSLCRADGLLLKPDKPARTVDAHWLSGVFNNTPGPQGRALWTTSTSLSTMTAAAAAAVATTGTTRTWGYVLVAESEAAWSGSAATLNLPGGANATSGVAWTRPKHSSVGTGEAARIIPADITLVPFTDAKPLLVPATGKDYGDFELIYTAPMLANGMVLLGEVAKVVAVSAARFTSVSAATAGTIDLELAGVLGEHVEVYYVGSGGTTAKSASCVMGSSGSCALKLLA